MLPRTRNGALLAVVSGVVALVFLIVGIAVAVMSRDAKDDTQRQASASRAVAAGAGKASELVPSATAPGTSVSGRATTCAWTDDGGPVPDTNKFVGYPPTQVSASGSQIMTMTTNLGTITAEVSTEKVPCAAASLTFLTGKAYFDGTTCHRLVTAGLFILQCGDPSGTGSGGPGYKFDDENLDNLPKTEPGSAFSDPVMVYPAGAVAMANYGSDTNGSQFFIVYQDTELAATYPVIGNLRQGLDLVRQVAAGGVTPRDIRTPNDGIPKTTLTIAALTMSSPRS